MSALAQDWSPQYPYSVQQQAGANTGVSYTTATISTPQSITINQPAQYQGDQYSFRQSLPITLPPQNNFTAMNSAVPQQWPTLQMNNSGLAVPPHQQLYAAPSPTQLYDVEARSDSPEYHPYWPPLPVRQWLARSWGPIDRKVKYTH